ncbi:MAG: hypothetical protein QOF82_2696 [Frankiales bacterium]|nr:hypothetical protein [Frankiales bacterium]
MGPTEGRGCRTLCSVRLHHGRLAAPLTVAVLGLTACTSHGSPTAKSGTETPSASSVTTSPSPSPTVTTTPPGPKLVQLPFGGRQILPKYRVVAYYGNGQSKALGVLGHYTPDQAAQQVAAAAKKFATPTRPALPAIELIASLVDGYKGSDGDYSHDSTPAQIQPYLDAARKHHELLILDLQPGRRNFLTVVKLYQQFLLQPDVGVALDSEWRMGPTQIPSVVRGHVSAAEINSVTAYLSKLTVSHGLPQKVVVLHNFTQQMIPDRTLVKSAPALAIVWHFDGHGDRNNKLFGYNLLKVKKPFYNGFKLFLKEDINIFKPTEVDALTPAPDFISYQ